MAIEVGALTLAIGADNQRALKALAELDRRSEELHLRENSRNRRSEKTREGAYRARNQFKQAQRNLSALKAEGASVDQIARATERLETARFRKNQAGHSAAITWTAIHQANRDDITKNAALSDRFYAAEASKAQKVARLDQARFEQQAGWEKRKGVLQDQAIAEDIARTNAANTTNANYQNAKRASIVRTAEMQGQYIMRIQSAERAAYAEDAARTKAKERAATALANKQIAAAQRTARSAAIAARASAGRNPIAGGVGGVTGSLVGALALAELIRTANQMQLVQQRLAQVSASGAEAAIAFDRLGTSSQALRQPLAETAELYTKLRQSNSALGLSANETLKVTEAFSAALRISGATGQSAASSLLQFGQAMAKGKLDGDEFRTVSENASEVLRVLERQFNLTRGQILKMREEGKLTSKMIADALIKEVETLTQRAAKLGPTLAQSMTQFRNAMLIAMTNTADAKKAMDSLANGISSLAGFVQSNGPLLVGMGEFALRVYLVKKALNGLEFAVTTLTRKMMLNPFTLALVGLAAALALVAKAQYDVREAARAQDAEIVGTTRLIDANKVREKILRRVVAAQEEVNAKTRAFGAESPTTMNAQKKLEREMDLLKKAGEQMVALRDMGTGAIMVTADAVTDKVKKLKDPTDELISSLATLFGAGKMSADDMAIVQALAAIEEKALKAVDAVRRAQAISRLEDLGGAGFVTPDKIPQDRRNPIPQKPFEFGKLEVPKVREEGSPFERSLVRMNEDLQNSLTELLFTAPRDIFIGLFEGLGRQFAQGGSSLKDTMLGVIGNIFVSMGSSLIPFGKLMTFLKAKLTLNPLLAGPAALVAGAALITLGSAMSSSVSGGGRGSGGNFGSIGGLGIGGGANQPMIYRFGDRQNPAGGSRMAQEGSGGVVVNATIIGPNDPQAQRQITALIDNAARRGLGNGSGMRT